MKFLKFAVIAALTFALAFAITQNPVIAAFLTGTALAIAGCITTPLNALGAYVGATGMTDGNVQVVSQERDRSIYEHNRQRFEGSGKRMTPGYLRLEAVIKGNGILQFKTYDGDGAAVYPTERRLDRNDSFIATKVGMYLLKQDVANGKTNGRLHTYPNITEFGAAAAADLETLYNAELIINIDRKQLLVGYDTRNFLYVPQTQQSASTNRDNVCGQKGGIVKLTPQIIINGSGTNDLSIKYPVYNGWAGQSATAGIEHRCVLYFRGLHVTTDN